MLLKPVRFWEVDCLRGLAVLMMLLYHFLVDLEMVSGDALNLTSGFWGRFQQLTASLFLLVVGISLTITYYHDRKDNFAFSNYFRRGLKLLCWAFLITLITRWLFSASYVVFGILHLIGLSSILVFPLLRFKWLNLLLGITLLLIGVYLERFRFPFSTLVWIGFTPRSFNSLDYFPVLPWSGWILIGLFLGKQLYPENQRRFSLPDYSTILPVQWICAVGRRSLIIYLTHQPLLMLGVILGLKLLQP